MKAGAWPAGLELLSRTERGVAGQREIRTPSIGVWDGIKVRPDANVPVEVAQPGAAPAGSKVSRRCEHMCTIRPLTVSLEPFFVCAAVAFSGF